MHLLLVNFGGPRDTDEVAPFLTELLCDRDVIRTRLPSAIHKWVFSRVARKRALKTKEDYEQIGGRSPIFFDTETIARYLADALGAAATTFHRYLPATHEETLRALESSRHKEILVLPLFPQFCYATTGSIARFFATRLKADAVNKLRWIHSFATHPAFIRSYRKKVSDALFAHGIAEEEAILLFSAHGVPVEFPLEGDPYQSECEKSFEEVKRAFPKAICRLSYQSKFGPGEWIRPYTDEMCEQMAFWSEGRKKALIVPLSFTSDHIETLFEIEQLYLPMIRAQGIEAFRCPALNLEPYWLRSLEEIIRLCNPVPNQFLIRGALLKQKALVADRTI